MPPILLELGIRVYDPNIISPENLQAGSMITFVPTSALGAFVGPVFSKYMGFVKQIIRLDLEMKDRYSKSPITGK